MDNVDQDEGIHYSGLAKEGVGIRPEGGRNAIELEGKIRSWVEDDQVDLVDLGVSEIPEDPGVLGVGNKHSQHGGHPVHSRPRHSIRSSHPLVRHDTFDIEGNLGGNGVVRDDHRSAPRSRGIGPRYRCYKSSTGSRYARGSAGHSRAGC